MQFVSKTDIALWPLQSCIFVGNIFCVISNPDLIHVWWTLDSIYSVIDCWESTFFIWPGQNVADRVIAVLTWITRKIFATIMSIVNIFKTRVTSRRLTDYRTVLRRILKKRAWLNCNTVIGIEPVLVTVQSKTNSASVLYVWSFSRVTVNSALTPVSNGYRDAVLHGGVV